MSHLLYETASALHRAYVRRMVGQCKLPGKTLSVGNITWGGTGKTQFALWLLSSQKNRQNGCAVLTRGYRGGDEAVLYKNSGFLCGVGKDRAKSASKLMSSSTTRIDRWILDDGLQHWRLERDVDVVMMDCLSPFGWNGKLIPFGSLRERPEVALRRASCVILHNANLCSNAEQIRKQVLPYLNSKVPIIFSQSQVQAEEEEGQDVVAFAGIGNNNAFFQSLNRRALVQCISFRDHQHFTAQDVLNRLSVSRPVRFLTTEKDLARNASLAGPPLFAKAVRVQWKPMGGDLDQFYEVIGEFLN